MTRGTVRLTHGGLLLTITTVRGKKVKFEDVEAVVQFIRRLDQKASKGAIALRMELELSKSQKALATKELKEAEKL